jgi:RND family efflux transporter MFP subunit
VWRIARVSAVILAALVMVPAGVARAESGAPVTAATAEMRPIVNMVRLSGTVVSTRAAGVSTAVAGLVEAVKVDLGDRVGEGDTLIELDRALALQDVRRAEAALSEAEARLADENRRLRVAERLIKRGNVPQNELEARQAEARIATAAVERLKAEAARERERLRRHTIYAPFSGVVARKVTEAGEWVSPGETVVELVSTDNLRVDIPVPQNYYPQLAAEAPVEVEFDALPGTAFKAERAALVPVSDPRARTFTLRVRLAESDAPLTPGMSARVALHLATGEEGIVVPRDAVIRHPDGRVTVWVLQEEGARISVTERRVELGRGFDGLVHVLIGVSAGERVVVRGNESLRQGQRVRVLDEAS